MYNDEENGNVNSSEENSSYTAERNGGEASGADAEVQDNVNSSPEPVENTDYQPNFTFRDSSGEKNSEQQDADPGTENAAEKLFASEARAEETQNGFEEQNDINVGAGPQNDYVPGSGYGSTGQNDYASGSGYGSSSQNNYGSQSSYSSQGSYSSQNNYGSQGSYNSQNNYGSQGSNGSQSNYDNQNSYGGQNNYDNQSSYGSQSNYDNQNSYGSQSNYGNQSSYGSQNNYDNQNGYGSQNNYDNQNGYNGRYNAYEDQDISRWQPDQDKYNSYDPNKVVTVKKSGRRWWLPVVIILAVLVVAIGVLAVVLFVKLDQSVDSSVDNSVEDVTVQEVETVDSVESSSSDSSSGIVLTDVSDVVDSVMPSVVSITSRTIVESGGYDSLWGYFYGYGSNSSSESEEIESGIGSGTIVGQNDTELLILTSYHVVEDCSSLYVTFNDDSSVDGYIKSYEEDVDIAVVAVLLEDISSDTLSAIKIATLCTEEVEVGEGIIVIGDALGYGQSVVTGIISATGREITVDDATITVLQTDAAINSGNSGGCVLNSSGEIVGISEAKIQDTSVEGMCYAIPIYDNYELIQTLLTTETTTDTDSSDSSDSGSSDTDDFSGFGDIFGNYDSEAETIPSTEEDETSSSSSSSSGAYLGIYGRDIDSDLASSYGLSEGVYVADVTSGGGAEAAGIQSGDIIIGADGQDLTTMTELQAILAEHSAGDTIEIVVLRLQDSEYVEMTFEVTLTETLE